MIKKLQQLGSKTKLKIYKKLSICCDEMNRRNFRYEQDTFSKIVQCIR